MAVHSYSVSLDDLGISLAPLELNDIERLRVLRNSSHGAFVDQRIISVAEQLNWFYSYLEREGDYCFAAFDMQCQQNPVGFCALYDFDFVRSCAQFGRLVVDPQFRGMKLGSRITQAACAVLFESFELNTVELEVLSDNTYAMEAYRTAGFELVGPADKHLRRMSISRSKWQERSL